MHNYYQVLDQAWPKKTVKCSVVSWDGIMWSDMSHELDVATVMSPIGLWTPVLKPWVCYFGHGHLGISCVSVEVTKRSYGRHLSDPGSYVQYVLNYAIIQRFSNCGAHPTGGAEGHESWDAIDLGETPFGTSKTLHRHRLLLPQDFTSAPGNLFSPTPLQFDLLLKPLAGPWNKYQLKLLLQWLHFSELRSTFIILLSLNYKVVMDWHRKLGR